MAIAGDMHHIPSFPISLNPDGTVKIHSWATNKAREIVEQDIDRAVRRLLAGETFNMHCSGMQVYMINKRLQQLKVQQ